MKRFVSVIFILCLFGSISHAQVRIGVTAGLDINYPISDALYLRPSPGYSFGIIGEYPISNSFGIKAELVDSDIKYGYTKLSNDQIYAIQQTKMNVISIPLQGIWTIQIPNKLYCRLGLGLQYSHLCSGSAYICDPYGQGELWEIDQDSKKYFDVPDYHAIDLKKVETNMCSAVASLEITSKHFGVSLILNKGLSPFTKQVPFISGTEHKTFDRFGLRITYYL